MRDPPADSTTRPFRPFVGRLFVRVCGDRVSDDLGHRSVELELRCGCGFAGTLGHGDLVSASIAVCPGCGDVATMPRTAELELLEVRTALVS